MYGFRLQSKIICFLHVLPFRKDTENALCLRTNNKHLFKHDSSGHRTTREHAIQKKYNE